VREDAVEVHVVGADDPVRQRVQTEIGVGSGRRCGVEVDRDRDDLDTPRDASGPAYSAHAAVADAVSASSPVPVWTSGNQVSRIVPFSLVVARPMPHTVRCSLMPSRLSKPDPR
jgi:hypothetical protein